MALSIHTNYSSLVTQTNLNKTNNALSTNQQRLGTGLRINSAADDAAGLQIATRLNAQSRGMAVAMRNTGDAVSLLQTAEGAFSEMTDILQRMKDLATQSANGTNSETDRTSLQAEYDELGKEVANIIKNTTFAGEALFSDGTEVDGSGGKFSAAVSFQIGATSAETLSFDVNADLTLLTDDAAGLQVISYAYIDGTASIDISVTTAGDGDGAVNAHASIDGFNAVLDVVGTLRSGFDANINRLNHTANNLANMKDNTDMTKGRI